MSSPHPTHAREADRVANRICRRRLMNASLVMAAAWLTYVNPFTLQIHPQANWPWLSAVITATAVAASYALWSITAGDRRAWMRAFHAATSEPLESATGER